jgi:adenosylcobinamide-GDP ribazoletransferase
MGFITALRTLTILPVPGKDAERMSSALPWFPVVGLLLGAVFYAIAMIPKWCGSNGWPEGFAAIIVLLSIIFTRALHLDGLADCADGFGCRGDREKTLAVMKDPHIGAFGVIALVVAVLVQWVSLTRIIDQGAAVWVIAAYVVSRTMMVELAVTMPYARQEGGTAAPFVNGARPWHRFVSLGLCALVTCGICGPAAGSAIVVCGWVICRIFGWWCKRKISGITGDTLGACGEIVETAILFAGASASNVIHLPHLWILGTV